MRRPIFFGHCSSGSNHLLPLKLMKKEKTRFLQSGVILVKDLATRMIKKLPANAGDVRDTGLILGQGDPWRRKWQPTPIFLPGKFHGQRNLAGYNPWSHRSWRWLSIHPGRVILVKDTLSIISFKTSGFFWGGRGRREFSYANAACRILISWPGLEILPVAVKVESLNHWTAREFPASSFKSWKFLGIFD